MGNYRGAKIVENRQYDNPADPANSDYDVIFEVTVPGAVVDPTTGENLSEILAKKAGSTHSHSEASATAPGFMSTTDKGKVDKIPANYDYANPPVSVDTALSTSSTKPVQNKVVTAELNNKFPTAGGTMTGNLTVQGTITATGNITGAKVYNAVWSADYAEGFEYDGQLPEPGEIIELCGENRVRVASAESGMVIGVCSDTYWALAGCALKEIEEKKKVAVGLVGQIKIKVFGPVNFGDYIVCVGNGIGEARSNPSLGHSIGRAMESNSEMGVKMVNCLINIK